MTLTIRLRELWSLFTGVVDLVSRRISPLYESRELWAWQFQVERRAEMDWNGVHRFVGVNDT